jgi:hypothetical protein
MLTEAAHCQFDLPAAATHEPMMVYLKPPGLKPEAIAAN